MAHPYLALRPTRNGRVSHYAVAGSKNPLPLGMGSVKLNASQLAFLTADMRWKVEKGAVDLMIGRSCEDIVCQMQIQIGNDGYPDGAARGFYARAKIR